MGEIGAAPAHPILDSSPIRVTHMGQVTTDFMFGAHLKLKENEVRLPELMARHPYLTRVPEGWNTGERPGQAGWLEARSDA